MENQIRILEDLRAEYVINNNEIIINLFIKKYNYNIKRINKFNRNTLFEYRNRKNTDCPKRGNACSFAATKRINKIKFILVIYLKIPKKIINLTIYYFCKYLNLFCLILFLLIFMNKYLLVIFLIFC